MHKVWPLIKSETFLQHFNKDNDKNKAAFISKQQQYSSTKQQMVDNNESVQTFIQKQTIFQ